MKIHLKEIARGVKGARDLGLADAEAVMTQVLAGSVDQLELGAFLIAMRIKGESVEELLGFKRALDGFLNRVSSPQKVIVLPSYNGARKTGLLTPLLANQLAARGIPVLIHGLHEEANRVGTGELFKSLHWPIANSIASAEEALRTHKLVYAPLEILSPKLADLLKLRHRLGLRNSGHVLAKLMNPMAGDALQIVNYTHPEYPAKLQSLFQRERANAILLSGHEGEPTCSFTLVPTLIHCQLSGEITLTEEYNEPVTHPLPESQESLVYTHRVLSGEAPLPAALTQFVLALSSAYAMG